MKMNKKSIMYFIICNKIKAVIEDAIICSNINLQQLIPVVYIWMIQNSKFSICVGYQSEQKVDGNQSFQ